MNIVFSETEERKRKNTLKNQEMKGRKSIWEKVIDVWISKENPMHMS
jgi:hypothetical protein